MKEGGSVFEEYLELGVDKNPIMGLTLGLFVNTFSVGLLKLGEEVITSWMLQPGVERNKAGCLVVCFSIMLHNGVEMKLAG